MTRWRAGAGARRASRLADLDRSLSRTGMPRPRLPRLPTLARWLAAAAVLAVAAALLQSAPATSAVPTAAVLVAGRDLTPGVPLRASDLRLARWPRADIPRGALSDAAAATGGVLTSPARQGEPITDVRLLGTALLRASGPGGLVAAPVRVADPGVLGLVHPGDRVDVLAVATENDSDAGNAPETQLVANNVVILSVPPSTSDSTSDGSLLVIATTPAVAARLATAAVHARLSLTLHGR